MASHLIFEAAENRQQHPPPPYTAIPPASPLSSSQLEHHLSALYKDATAAQRQVIQEAVEKLLQQIVLELSNGEKRVGGAIEEVAREVRAVEMRLGARMDELQAQGRRIEGVLEGEGEVCVFVFVL